MKDSLTGDRSLMPEDNTPLGGAIVGAAMFVAVIGFFLYSIFEPWVSLTFGWVSGLFK